MTDYRDMERRLFSALGLRRPPVGVAFRESPPPGVARFEGSAPAGCSFWRIAAGGRAFYTVPADHYNCPIGAYTHNISLPEARAQELPQTLSLMSSIGYIRMEEVPSIPRLPRPPGAVVYAPLGEMPVDPDVVLFVGAPGRVMLLQEAAGRADVAVQAPLFGRPTCMALPAALALGSVVSVGCIGNRVYTDVGEDELYVVVPGRDLPKIAAEIETIAGANAKLTEYHRDRRATLSTA